MNTRQVSALGLVMLMTIGSTSAQQSSESTRQEIVSLRAEDGAGLYAAYHTPAGRQPTVGFVFMHPRGGNVTHFALKPLAERGFAALGMGSRSLNRTGVHEELVLDVAAGVKFMRSRGVKTVILAGHSGGGSLMAFYQSQAEAAPGNAGQEHAGG